MDGSGAANEKTVTLNFYDGKRVERHFYRDGKLVRRSTEVMTGGARIAMDYDGDCINDDTGEDLGADCYRPCRAEFAVLQRAMLLEVGAAAIAAGSCPGTLLLCGGALLVYEAAREDAAEAHRNYDDCMAGQGCNATGCGGSWE